jgi:TP901 family phage tail tape measure protein
LANSVVAAEVPIRRAHGALEELWVTMKNTMRWQITSSAMHGFMGAISTAYGYAQDLNESLNNIRIVSGQSVEQMADFAKEANKAAKILSTTTTDYTNAALIYYQQGLSDSEIKERTEITIKMANVARQSAEVVSDQLTAVWNNFYKEGDRALVYYADIMTALGAETASSTDEIAAGLEKFASIADMIGLSFEYAASSLATITATTRQSPEVVGTALKTIFARIQGLKLGETLEDGTDLNKYSDSLKRVGIDIFDTAGELKDMDVVLEEIGARWDSLATSE